MYVMELSCLNDECETVERFRVAAARGGGSVVHYALASLRSRSKRWWREMLMCAEWSALQRKMRELQADERALIRAIS